MTSLFPEIYPEPAPKRTGGTAGTCGRGPAGETCGSCQHIVRIGYHDKHYLKCNLMVHAWSHGPGTDIRRKWKACEHWEAK